MIYKWYVLKTVYRVMIKLSVDLLNIAIETNVQG